MAQALKHQLLIQKYFRKISPNLLSKLAHRFRIIDKKGMACVDAALAESFADTAFGQVPKDRKKEYDAFLKSFQKALYSLKSPKNDTLLIEAHILAVAIDYEITPQLEDLTHQSPGRLSAEDYIVSTYVNDGVDTLHQAIRMVEAHKAKRYEYYLASRQQLLFSEFEKVREPTDTLIKNALIPIKKVLDKTYGSKLCAYSKGVYGKRFHLDITHAGMTVQGDKAVENKMDAYVMQPVEYDTLFVDFTTGELCIHMEKARTVILQEYVKMMSDLFYEDEEHWSKDKKYNLRPLTLFKKGDLAKIFNPEYALKKLTINDEGAELFRIRLVDLNYSASQRDGTDINYHVVSKGCISTSLINETERLVEPKAGQDKVRITAATFAFDLHRTGTEGSSVRVNLTESSCTESNTIDGIDNWLSDMGMLRYKQTNGTPPPWFEKHAREQSIKYAPRRIVETVTTQKSDSDLLDFTDGDKQK